jgi:tetratricopeptide (TPR) repeat protein
MTNWRPYLAREAALKAIESRLAENAGDVTLQFEQACLLTALGQIEEAKQAYLKILSADPRHPGTLNNLGALLYQTGYRSAARTVYRQAVTHYPDNPAVHVNLANLLFDENDFDAARTHYEEALRLDPDQVQAHQGMTRIFSGMRDEAGASRHRERGFRSQAATTLPYLGKTPPVQLLLLVAADGGNIPLRQHIDNHVFMTTVIFADFYDLQKPLPLHQLVFNTIGDADLCRLALETAVKLLAGTAAPVLNPPEKVMATGRVENARRLEGLTGVKTAKTFLLSKKQILEQQGLVFPLLLRAPGFHTGQHFVKVDRPDQLAGAVAQLPGTDVLMMQYLDARGADGLARKYRVMKIGGKLYPLHLAISADWKVHYFTAAMTGHPRHQAEEKKFLEDMPSVVGPRGMAALERIKDALGLDYGGVDFGLDAEGHILLFEANATMAINPPGPEEQWAYRRAAIDRVQQAVREMLLQRPHQADTVLQENMV